MYTGVTLSAHTCKQVIPNVSETRIVTLTHVLTACELNWRSSGHTCE